MEILTHAPPMTRIHPIPCALGIAFLIETDRGFSLVDSGSPGSHNRVLAKMKELGRGDLRLIWITHAHYDHYGSAAALRELTGARIGVHPQDAASLEGGQSPLGTARAHGFIYPFALRAAVRIAPLLPTPADFTLGDGESLDSFGLDARVIHTPGHTPGHTCLLLDGKIAFAADLIASFPRPRLQRILATDWNQLSDSLARLQAAQPDWVYTGHSRSRMAGTLLMNIKPLPRR